MVLDVSIEEIDQPKVIRAYLANVPNLFTVHVDSKRILTVLTDHDSVTSKWLTELLRSKSTNTKPPLLGAASTFPPDSIFVGLVAEEHLPFYSPRPYDSTDHCLDLLTFRVGSHCLMLELEGGHYDPQSETVVVHDGARLASTFPSDGVQTTLENDQIGI